MEAQGGTVSAAVREHLRQLCLHEFPCGTGSWVRAPAGPGAEGRARAGGADGPVREARVPARGGGLARGGHARGRGGEVAGASPASATSQAPWRGRRSVCRARGCSARGSLRRLGRFGCAGWAAAPRPRWR